MTAQLLLRSFASAKTDANDQPFGQPQRLGRVVPSKRSELHEGSFRFTLEADTHDPRGVRRVETALVRESLGPLSGVGPASTKAHGPLRRRLDLGHVDSRRDQPLDAIHLLRSYRFHRNLSAGNGLDPLSVDGNRR